jgi:hypothetical protein
MKRLDGVVIALCVVGLLAPILLWYGLTAALTSLDTPDPNEKYPRWGKDTRAEFGDRRFQILGSRDDMHLMDFATDAVLLDEVVEWREKGDWVYAFGNDGKTVWHKKEGYWGPRKERVYLVLNHRNASVQKFKKLQDIPPAASLRSRTGRDRSCRRDSLARDVALKCLQEQP